MPRKDSLDRIASEIVVCPLCGLCKTRKNAVPGEGKSNSQVMFVGEGPGRVEDLEGRPFVGPAGRFLGTLLSEARLPRDDVFICNVVRCRPPRNREPRPDEIEACSPYLDRQIKLIKPKLIVTLGKHSTAHIFQKASLSFTSITREHGELRETNLLDMHVAVFPTFHPAAALHDPKYAELIRRDFQLLGRELQKRQVG